MSESYLYPIWPSAPLNMRIKSCITTRWGGFSLPPYEEFNLALHVGDDPNVVAANRAKLQEVLPSKPVWLNQVHGIEVFDADHWVDDQIPTADAAITSMPGRVLAIMTADCLPIMLCDKDAKVVGLVHAGWRGLSAGVIEKTVHAMLRKLGHQDASTITAYLGPAIGPSVFEVGAEVRAAFIEQHPEASLAFEPSGHPDKYLANLYRLAAQRFERMSIRDVLGGDACTYSDEKFYSYRKNQKTGRMASFIWLDVS